MTDQFSMFHLMTFGASPNVISSPGSAVGPMPFASPVGTTPGPSGRARPLASPSAPLESSLAATIPATSPPILSAWSGPAAPECCLASKSPARKSSEGLQSALETALRRRLSGHGSMIYQTAWKPHVTPLGRQIFRLRASARSTSDSAPSSLPSPTNGWNTPRATDGSNGGPNQANGALPSDAALAGWPTCTATDALKQGVVSPRPGAMGLSETAPLTSGWPTPKALDCTSNVERLDARMMREGRATPSNLPTAADLTGPARLTASGTLLTGSSAAMGSGGQLNPRFSGWLMRYPPSWCVAALSCPLPSRSPRKPKEMPAE